MSPDSAIGTGTGPTGGAATTGTHSTPPLAAPPARRILAQARFETLAVLRNGEQLMVTLIIPVAALLALGRSSFIEIGTGTAARIDVVTPGILALAVLAGSMTSQAIATAFDRRNGVLRMLATTPLGPGGLLAGKAVAVLIVAAVQVIAVGAVGLALGWRPDPAGLPGAAVALLLGVATFTALALLLAGTLRAEAVLAAANLLLILLIVVGGVVLPAADLPDWWAAIAVWLPPGALGEALRTSLVDGVFPVVHLLVLAGWTVLLGAGVRRWFHWS